MTSTHIPGSSTGANAQRSAQFDQVVWLLIAIGIALRVWQVAGGASLWLDEIALAQNIVERGYAALLTPLDHAQVAPPGFLLAERFFWSLFHSDVSLRIVPLAGSIASLFFMRAVARRALGGIAVPLAVGALAVGLPHIVFAGQVKQYSTDVTFALALVLLVARLLDSGEPSVSRYVLAGATGFVAVWFSNPAVLVVTGLGAALALLVLQGKITNRGRVIGFVLLPWIIGAGAASLIAMVTVSPATMAFMKEYWDNAFAPMPPRSLHDLLWPWQALVGLFGMPWGFRYPVAPVFVVLALAGFVLLWRTRRDLTLLVLGPILVTFGVAAVRVYPFEGRLVLYLTPFLLLAVAAATTGLATWIGARVPYVGAAVVLLVSLASLEPVIENRPTYRLQEMRGLLDWVASQRRPGDAVFVWYRAAPNVQWYRERTGIAASDIVEGGCWLTEPRNFLRDLDKVRGRPRVWIVITGASLPEGKLLLSYAGQIGVRGEGKSMPTSFPRYHVDAWLYDFSDATRLASASSETFPIKLPRPATTEVMACKTFFGR
ncbi:MAG: hypothetical protein ABI625_26540 [bacterium]